MPALHPELAGAAQVFARDLRQPESAPLIFLPRGDAATLRPDARAGHLICPLRNCASPALTARGGSRRDHFAHLVGGGGHAKETLAHHTSKHLIARWLRSRLSDTCSITVDHDEVENGQRPDVLLTLGGGAQVAYEVQFAALTPEEWLRRHQGYRGQGIRDVWLFGGRHIRRPRIRYAGERDLAITVLLARVLREQHPVLIVDPFEECVGLGTGWVADSLLGGADHRGGEYQPEWTPLVDVPVSHGMPVLPGWLPMRQRATQRRLELERQLAARQAWLGPLQAAWEVERTALLKKSLLDPATVELLEQGAPDDALGRTLGLLGPHWRWHVLASCPQPDVGAVVSVRSWCDALASRLGVPQGDSPASRRRRLQAAAAVQSFLPIMRRLGWVHYDGRSAAGDVLILANSSSPTTVEMQAAVKARRWRLHYDTLELLGERPDDVLLSISPPPVLLPPPLRRLPPGPVSRAGRRLDAELRALDQRSRLLPSQDLPAVPGEPSSAPLPLNFVEHVHRGVQAHRRELRS